MTFERILSHFQVRKRGTGKAQCICPAHADREASLTLTDGNDRALITRIDTGGVSKGMNAVKAGMTRISAQVSKMGDSAKSSFQRQITAITDLYQNYEKQERKVSELKSKLEELSKVRIETEEYKKLKDDIKALEDEFEKVETKQREWLDMGFSIDSAPLQELDKQMDDIWADIGRLQRKQKEMVPKQH